MSCCPASGIVKADAQAGNQSSLAQWVQHLDENHDALDLLVPTVHCGACINRIETTYAKQPGINKARVNLSSKRLSLVWDVNETNAGEVMAVVESLGYDARPFDKTTTGELESDETGKRLLRSLAVAGFAAGNVMLLSVSVWAGAEGATRQLFQWLSALIALPAIFYAGQPFFRSALNALSHKRLNMDVPISLAVLLAAGMSLFETINKGPETYFDAAVTLLFFLLAGRYLDHMMREKARSAVSRLLSLNMTGATVISRDGEKNFTPVSQLRPGMTIAVMAGERLPVDGTVLSGTSDVDRSIVTGEAMPETIGLGQPVEAGVMNLTGPLTLRVTATGKNTFLGEVVQLMETAEQGKARYMRIADRAAQIYAPAVHALAALTFLGWLIWTGGDWHAAMFTAIAVLIITCPCALGLAVPAVQIVASGMLFRRGVLVKDGSALERMSDIDMVVFDKTGTLTTGKLKLSANHKASERQQALTLALAGSSNHPLSKALSATLTAAGVVPARVDDIREIPGQGVEGYWNRKRLRLGAPEWAGGHEQDLLDDNRSRVVLAVAGEEPLTYHFNDELRGDARATIGKLQSRGLDVAILSGDLEAPVRSMAASLGVTNFHARRKPADKVAFIEQQMAGGKKVLMVGDGINDAPSLAAATASMAPASASDIGKTAADMVFTTPNLSSVLDGLDISNRSTSHIRQNFGLAIAYNVIAVPLAMFGLATPLIAAVAMSSSSILVTANALRMRLMPRSGIPVADKTPPQARPVAQGPNS
jgi:Cu2+-exporting ATPase